VGLKWDDLIVRIEWKWSIFQFIQEAKLDPNEKAFLITMSLIHPEKFDEFSLEGGF